MLTALTCPNQEQQKSYDFLHDFLRVLQDSPRSQSKLRLKFSGDSSLFGSPRTSARPEGSAQSIIQQLHADSFSSRVSLLPNCLALDLKAISASCCMLVAIQHGNFSSYFTPQFCEACQASETVFALVHCQASTDKLWTESSRYAAEPFD